MFDSAKDRRRPEFLPIPGVPSADMSRKTDRKKHLPKHGPLPTLAGEKDQRKLSFPAPKGAALASATAVFSGPFRVKADDGRDITPTSPLRQAILAVLLLAPQQMKARRSLQSMFWGAADSTHASANLRTALYQLRQDLLPLGSEVLRADRQMVSLLPSTIRADLVSGDALELLEGLDLPLADCDGFEDWLRSLRQSRGGRNAQSDDLEAPPFAAGCQTGRTAPALLSSYLALGLLPTVSSGLSAENLTRIEAEIDQICHFFKFFTLLDVHDLRDAYNRVMPLPLESARGPTHLLQSLVHSDGAGFRLRLRLLDAHTRKLLWLSQPIAQVDLDRETTAQQLGECIVECMRSHPPHPGSPDLFPFTALTAFFSLDPREIDKAEAQLQRMVAAGGHPVLQCLLLFAQVFKVNEQLGPSVQIDMDQLLDTLCNRPISDPMLPVCQSLYGYSVHMLQGNNELAHHLIENAWRLAPNLALNLDHLVVINLARGDVEAAIAAWNQLNQVGQNSPWRYTYDITGAMVHLLRGDLRQSLYFANQSLFRKPRYLAALRYSMIGSALSNRPDDAIRMLDRIRVLRPGYDLTQWVDGFVMRMPAHLAKSTVQSLRQNELL
ncbi:MAG: hypothetical protein J0L76_12380 [Rhodobacterales bacterium]|nr:hypothetical protein [Rhodobacterales bacterium]